MMNQTLSDVEERRENIAGAANVGPEGITPPDPLKKALTLKKKSLDKQLLSHSGANSKANAYVDREKLLRERHELRVQREKTIEERKKIDLDLKGLNDQVQRKDDACAKLKAGLRFKTEAGIDDAVKRLERQVQVQQLRLQEEKRLVAEINKLKRSKRNLSEYLALKEEVDLLRNNQTKLRERRDGCVKQLNRMKSREEVVKNLLESSDNSTVEEGESKQAELVKKKEDVKQELKELRTKKKNLSDNFSMEKRKYKEEVKEMKAQKQKEVLTRRKNERFVTQKEMETNRSKHEPFVKEKALCDTLIGHFEKLHFFQAPDVSSATAADKELSLPQRADAEFSGSDSEGTFLPRKSATDDLFDVFGGNSRIQRKGSRKGRRSSVKEVEFLVKAA
ncbi:Uncharacterized protein P5673_031641 [Acropora cervicornis]|uniref:Uncharacterized protein n=1 Tax=Acropora cervicornis TaxID=6130 RepID=A0AAD9USE7_ACRCE|nr:Uncharacterized protein P5673_031641 [Acropora cervicornis]